MFTGLVQKVAHVSVIEHHGSSMLLGLEMGDLAPELRTGDSVLVDGVCLTAAGTRGARVRFDIAAETLRLSTLGSLKAGDRVNVELAMRPTDRFGGHFVSGHVDGIGTILEKARRPGETILKVKVPSELAQMMVMKGSVAVDGISLTIAGLEDAAFEASLIPHTLAATTLQYKGPGAHVNVECDMVGKWVRKFVEARDEREDAGQGLTRQRLAEQEF